MSTPITDIFNQNKEVEKKSNQSSINQIDFAKAFEVGLQQGQDISPTSFSFLLNTVSSKTGKQSTFTFDDKSKEAFKNKYGEKQLKQAETLMAQSLMTNNTVNSIASYYAPNRTVNQLYDPEYAMFFPQAKMTSYVKPKDASIEFEWNGMATPITKFTTEEIADVNSVFYDSYAKMFKPLNKDVINKWESDDWSFDKGSFAEGLNSMFGLDKKEGTERVTLMRNEDIAKLDTEDGRRIKSELALGNLNAKEIFRLQDTDGNFKPVWRTVTQNEDPFDLNNIRSVWGPKTVNNNNIAIEALESFNDSFMSALDGAYFTTYGARKLASPFLSPFIRDADFNKQLENEYNKYQQWSQGRRSTAADEEGEEWYNNMTNLTKGVANGLGQLISTAGVGFAGKTGVGLLMGASKAAGSKIFANTLSTMPANIARGFSASYAMGAAQQEARRAGLSENESMLMAGLAGVTLQLSEQMIGGNDSWLYRSFLPKEISSKAGKFITERVQAEAKLAGKTIADTMKDSASRSKIMSSTLKWLTEETDSWWKAGVQSFTQEAFQEVTEDGINKLNQFGFNTVADGLKASGYDWINDEARYKINLRDTLKELGGSFVIGGLTGAVSGSAITAFNSQQDIDKQLNGAKMNSLVYHYVDNKGNVQDYFDQLDLLKNNELTGSPYVSSKVDRDSKTRTLWDKLGLSTDTANTKTTETDSSKYMYDVMRAEAEWVFSHAQKIESELKNQGINPWENAQRFGQQITELLNLQPKGAVDVLMIDSKGKIMTLDEKTYKEVTKNYTPEELSKLQVNVLSPEAATRTKVDLTTRDIESSVFLEGMTVYNKKNDVQKTLAIQLAKRNSNSLFRETNPSDVTAFDGNYKGMMVDRQLSYEEEFDREYTENFNKLRSEPIKQTKDAIRAQQKLMLEIRDIETQIEELENKATRYGYEQVSKEVVDELTAEKIAKRNEVDKLEGQINSILNSDLQFSGSEERNTFKTDLRNLVDYENYTDRLTDRVKYYESKSQFNRLFNDSTFTEELNKLFNNKKGWSPYDYDEDKRKRTKAEEVIRKLHSKLIGQVNQTEEIKQREIKEDKDLIQLLEDIKKLKFADTSFKIELNQKLKDLSTTPVSRVKNKVTNTVKNYLKDGLEKSDLQELNTRKKVQFNLLSNLENLTPTQLENLKSAYNTPTKFIESLEEQQTIDLGVLTINYELLEEAASGGSLKDALQDELNGLFSEDLLKGKLNNDPNFEILLQAVKDDYSKQFEEAQALYTIKNIIDGLQEVNVPNLDYLINNQLQDNNEGFILEEASKALLNKYISTELESPAYYKNIANQVNTILPRLFYHYGDRLVGEDLELYNLVTNPSLTSADRLPVLRQRYKNIIQNGFEVSEDYTVHPVVSAVILREELEQTAMDLEAALSKRYLQDINFQHDYISDKKETLIEFLNLLKEPRFDVIQTVLTNFELGAQVIPTDGNRGAVKEYVQDTIDKLADFLNLEKQISELLTEEDALKLSKGLLETKSVEAKAFLFRRFDDKGIKYKKSELNESAQLERDLNYLFLLLRGNSDYYKDLKHLLSKSDETKDFIINIPQFFSLRQVYSFLAGSTLPESLTNELTEQVRLNIIQHQKTILESDTEFIILDPTLIKTPGSLRWGSQIYNLQGIPGVGKTEYLLKHALKLNKYKDPSAKILVTAPGDSQLATLKNSLKDESDINIEYLTWKDFEKLSKDSLNSYDLVIIDESSLLPPTELVSILDKQLNKDTKLILSGDQLQESSNGVYALYTESEKTDHSATLFITERGETLDVSVRSGLVDLQKYIEAVAAYIPGVNNFVGRGFKTAGASTAVRNKMKKEAIENIAKTVKRAEFSYYQEGGITKRGVQLTNNFKEFVDQFKRTRDSGVDAYFIIPTATDVNSKKQIIADLNKAGIEVTEAELNAGTHPFVMLSRVAQGKTLKNVFTPFMLRKGGDPIQATANLSGFFVAASRAVDSLVVYQPDELTNTLLPFTSTQVASEAKILTYPPFKIGEDLSPDTKIRQENFINFINKLDTDSISETEPKSATEEKQESKKEPKPDDTEQEDKEIKRKEQELKTWKEKVSQLVGAEAVPSMQEFRTLVKGLINTTNDLIKIEYDNLIKLLTDSYPSFDAPFDTLDDTLKSVLKTNSENYIKVFNDEGFDYISNNKLIETLMTNKMEEIKKYNDNIQKTNNQTTTPNTIILNGEKVESRPVKIVTTNTPDYIQKRVGFKIELDYTGNVSNTVLTYPENVVLSDSTTDKVAIDAHTKGLEMLARLTQVISSDRTRWETFTKEVKFGDKTLEEILKSTDALEELQQVLFAETPDGYAMNRNVLLFKFNLNKLTSNKDVNRQKIVQTILLGRTLFGPTLGIKSSDFVSGDDYIDGNIILVIEKIQLALPQTPAKTPKKSSRTRATDTENQSDTAFAAQVIKFTDNIGKDKNLANSIAQNTSTDSSNFYTTC